MARGDAVLRELEGLESELGRVTAAIGAGGGALVAAARSAAADVAAAVDATEMGRLLHELRGRLERDWSTGEDDDHPAAIAAAFLIGVTVGRLSRTP